jgi:hypothetical protein
MAEARIIPVIPPMPDGHAGPGRVAKGVSSLPLAPVLAPRHSGRQSSVFDIRSVDVDGRVVDRFVGDALGWQSGDGLHWRICGGIVVISSVRVRGVRVQTLNTRNGLIASS